MGFKALFGRRVIYTDVKKIDASNVVQVLSDTFPIHLRNKAEIEYLYHYVKGNQPVLNRHKEVRPEIKNCIVENRANEIVSFKVGYLMGEPVQYVSRSEDEQIADLVSTLNNYMLSEDKPSKDRELAEWSHICGTAYRMVLPDEYAGEIPDEAPFEIYTPDPRFSYIVYLKNGLDNPRKMSVNYIEKNDGTRVFSVYTEDHYFEIINNQITKDEPQIFGIPMVEYPLNNARIGAFEVVLPLLDAINTVDSNRLDGVEQFVQALMLFHNVDITSDDFAELRREGALKYKDIDATFKAEVKYLTAELNQTQTQTLVSHLYDTVLTIVGMPNRNGGSSTSDTGTAVIMRDGWSAAEARAKDTELMFKKSEKVFLKMVLGLCRDLAGLNLKMSALEIRFTRRNYENIVEKANVLTMMLKNPKIAPQLAFIHCGMFSDPNIAWAMSKKYIEEQEKLEPKEDDLNEPGGQVKPGSGEGDQ